MQRLLEFNNFVKEITQDNSRNYKISVLEKYKENRVVLDLLFFIFNPYITTGISSKKLQRNVEVGLGDTLQNIATTDDLLNYIKNNNTGKDEVLKNIKVFKEQVLNNDNELCTLLDQIICKNIIIGIDTLTINKVIPDLIPTFNVMLANKYFDKPEIVDGKEFALTTKIDGGRIVALKKDNVVKFYTRAGQEYEGLVDLEKEMMSFMPENTCLDGEITLLDSKGLSSKEQYKETMKITRKDGEKHGIKMKCFDIMSADEFIAQKCGTIHKERRLNLDNIFNLHEFKYFEKLEVLYQGTDINKILEWLNYNIEHDEEGVMINISDAPYEFKRTNCLLKVKKMHDMDLPILGFEEGTNQYVGSVGAIITEYKGFKLKVGSGISKELRKQMWKHQEDYIGLTMSVQYFEETTNQNGGISLRFPIFLDFRYDK